MRARMGRVGIAIAAAGLAGVLLKIAVVLGGGPAELGADARLDLAAARLEAAGLTEVGRADVTADGTYRAAGFVRPGCRGQLMLVPLLRNAEFVGLTRRLPARPRYAVAGRHYDEIPILAVWFDTVTRRLFGRDGALPPFAWVEDGECLLAEALLAVPRPVSNRAPESRHFAPVRNTLSRG